ncbi:hypothetical protein AN958_03199, partial [Leucoagaricus sp. SymC.cos]
QKQIVCLSIFMQNTNQHCNTLQAMIGLFLQSAGAPEIVVDLLSHLGLSITTLSIYRTVDSLSRKANKAICTAGASKTTMFGLDNLDFTLKHATPTLENTHNINLCHISSASALPLTKAIWMNILCNPTGQPDHFCGLDWVIEHNNLYIK